jgi:hypothetical protein
MSTVAIWDRGGGWLCHHVFLIITPGELIVYSTSMYDMPMKVMLLNSQAVCLEGSVTFTQGEGHNDLMHKQGRPHSSTYQLVGHSSQELGNRLNKDGRMAVAWKQS